MNNPFEQIKEEFQSIKGMLQELMDRQQSKPITNSEEEQILSVQEASKLLRLTVSTIFSKVNRGELPAMKKGRRLYFSRTELLEYVKGGKKLSNAEVDKEVDAYIAKNKKGLNHGL